MGGEGKRKIMKRRKEENREEELRGEKQFIKKTTKTIFF